jgi:hypothetical protein
MDLHYVGILKTILATQGIVVKNMDAMEIWKQYQHILAQKDKSKKKEASSPRQDYRSHPESLRPALATNQSQRAEQIRIDAQGTVSILEV